MPIAALRVNVAESLPIVGVIHKGDVRVEGRVPSDLDYFRLEARAEGVEQAFRAKYGERPRRLHIVFPYHNREAVWETWMEEWDASGLVHRCDGQVCVVRRRADGSYDTTPAPCPYLSQPRTPKRPGCVPTGRLRFLLPSVYWSGQFLFITHAWSDIRQIENALNLLAHHGIMDLAGVEMDLVRSKGTIRYRDAQGRSHRMERWTVWLEPAPVWFAQHLAGAVADQTPIAPVITTSVQITPSPAEAKPAPKPEATVAPQPPSSLETENDEEVGNLLNRAGALAEKVSAGLGVPMSLADLWGMSPIEAIRDMHKGGMGWTDIQEAIVRAYTCALFEQLGTEGRSPEDLYAAWQDYQSAHPHRTWKERRALIQRFIESAHAAPQPMADSPVEPLPF